MMLSSNLLIVTPDSTRVDRYKVPTLGDLCGWLSARLHDEDRAWYDRDDLVYAINTAYAETAMATRCHVIRQSVTVVEDTHTYSVSPIFEPLQVGLGGLVLDRVHVGDMGVSLWQWDFEALSERQEIPTKWMHLTGPSIRVYPTPKADALTVLGTINQTPVAGGSGYVAGDFLTLDGGSSTDAELIVGSVSAGAVTIVSIYNWGTAKTAHGYAAGQTYSTTVITGSGTGCTVNVLTVAPLIVYGYAVPDALVADADTADALPAGLSVPALLDRAESELRRMRVTFGNNAVLHQQLWERWDAWAKLTEQAVKGQ